MPGHYPTRGEFRPHLCGEGEEADATARLFVCAGCRVATVARSTVHKDAQRRVDAARNVPQAFATNRAVGVASTMRRAQGAIARGKRK